ncbi:hypothetical protein JW899_01685 [Candidatus Uhrbacteria bacterium]|nr:hypothetical protein [Candidatus Uhrbacteria bacterium]
MAMSRKDRIQLGVIGAIIIVLLAVLTFSYRDRLLPKPDQAVGRAAVGARPSDPVSIDGRIFQRTDFKSLRHYGPDYGVTVPDTAGEDYRRPSPKMEVEE